MHNQLNHRAVKTLAYKIKDNIEACDVEIPELTELETIINFLIDGYLAYELIFDKDGYRIGAKALDPIGLTPELRLDSNQKTQKFWIQNKGEETEIELPSDKILYYSYNTYETSFSQSLYIGLIDATDLKFIKKHWIEVLNVLTNKNLSNI
jgi:hypothetical protein